MYHSPGLRDGVSAPGCVCAHPNPQPLEQNHKYSDSPWRGINSAGRRSSRSAGIAGKLRFAGPETRRERFSRSAHGHRRKCESFNKGLPSKRATIVHMMAASKSENEKQTGEPHVDKNISQLKN